MLNFIHRGNYYDGNNTVIKYLQTTIYNYKTTINLSSRLSKNCEVFASEFYEYILTCSAKPPT